jgi:hypothetical protein
MKVQRQCYPPIALYATGIIGVPKRVLASASAPKRLMHPKTNEFEPISPLTKRHRFPASAA